ncbi:hypothetical protein D3C79_868370 [compost metagenome]
MPFEHHANNRTVACQALAQYVFEHCRLAQRILGAVGVAAIDHDPRCQSSLGQPLACVGNAGLIVVRSLMAAAQNQVSVRVAQGLDNRRVALAVHAEVPVRMGGAAHGVAGNRDTTVGTILEAHGQPQAADHLTVNL